MAEPKRFDINKIENFLKNSADKAQTLSYWNAAVEHGKTVKEIDENLTSNVDDKQIADLLLRRTDSMNRRDRLIKARKCDQSQVSTADTRNLLNSEQRNAEPIG